MFPFQGTSARNPPYTRDCARPMAISWPSESLAKADAEENGTTFEEIDSIDFTEKEIDDDALFDEEYENACEFEWECMTGR